MKKGQKAPAEQISKKVETERINFLKNLSIGKWEKYLDINFMTNQSQNKFLTLREFCDKIKNQTFNAIISEGFDKHLVNFYSTVLQNKIHVNKQDFETDYLSGMSLKQISLKYNINQDNVRFLRQIYKIKVKGANYIKRKQTETPLNCQQKELVYGTLMGDGKRMSPSSLSIGHSDKAEDYVLWKYSILENIASKNSLKKEYYFDERYQKSFGRTRFYTHANSDIEFIQNQFYCSGKKIITEEILNNLSDFSLAVWYMDDGKIDWHYRNRKDGINNNPSITLCTESFSKSEHLLMTKWFKDKFNINAYIKNIKKGTGYRLCFSTIETQSFLNIIKKHIIPYMEYKVDYEKYRSKRQSLGLDS